MPMNQYLFQGDCVKYQIMAAEAIVKVDNEYWFVPNYSNELMRMDGKSYKIQTIQKFTDNQSLVGYSRIIYANGKLYMIPRNGLSTGNKSIKVYHLQTGEMTDICYYEPSEELKSLSDLFTQYIVEGKYIYVLPNAFHSVVRIDTDTDDIKLIRMKNNTVDGRITGGSVAVIDHKIYLCNTEAKGISILDCHTEGIETLQVGGEEKQFWGLYAVDHLLWLIPQKIQDSIEIYDIHTGMVVDTVPFPVYTDRDTNMTSAWNDGILYKGKIYLLYRGIAQITVIDTATKQIMAVSLPAAISIFERNATPSNRWIRYLKLHTIFEDNGELCVIDGCTGEWFRGIENQWRKVEKYSIYQNLHWEQSVNETNLWPLAAFLDVLRRIDNA